MSGSAFLQLLLFLTAVLTTGWALGPWIAATMRGEPIDGIAGRILGPLERAVLRAAGIERAGPMAWATYARALVSFTCVGTLGVYLLQRFQGVLPGNPSRVPGVAPLLALETAVSFATNTNWQSYAGEKTLSHLTQAAGLGVQNFVSAAAGIAVAAALIRGIRGTRTDNLGNFWVDLTRITVYLWLPLSVILALVLVSQGVVQSWRGPVTASLIDPLPGDSVRTLPLGPAAGQVAIKQLGTNGGGFFGANSAHPFENPTPFSGFLEMVAILAAPAGLCFAFGRLVGDRRHGRVYLAAMLAVFVPITVTSIRAEAVPPPALAAAGNRDGNLEGKEVRFGTTSSAIWAAATTAASNGSVNASHDSFSAVGALGPLWLIQLGEVVFGGVGSGLYGMFVFALIAVFVAGLLVGRTPEYLGKKIEAREIRLAALVILIPTATVLAGTAFGLALPAGRSAILNPGPHGLTEVLYAFSSAGNNNGSAFGGLAADRPFYHLSLSAAMWLGRLFVAVPVLAIAGSLAAKQPIPKGEGTLPTTGPLFGALLVGTVLLVGALTFLPALALGPIAEALTATAR